MSSLSLPALRRMRRASVAISCTSQYTRNIRGARRINSLSEELESFEVENEKKYLVVTLPNGGMIKLLLNQTS